MRGLMVVVLVLALGTLAAGSLLADPPASAPASVAKSPQMSAAALERLLDLMVEKGLLTAEEREELERQAAVEAEAAPPPPPAPVVVAPAPEKPKYPTVKTKMRVQPRFSVVQKDSGQPFFGERDDKTGGDGFAVRRVRFHINGQLNPDVGYFVLYQADNGAEDANLHVAQVEWNGWHFANLVAGQLQTPGGFEIVRSDSSLLLTDRATASLFLPPDKDIGIRLDGKHTLPGGMNYQLYLGNGSGKYKGKGNSDGYLWMARVCANPVPCLNVAASFSQNHDTDYSEYQARFLKKNNDPYGLLPAYTAATVDETHWGLDFQYERDALAVWGEYLATRIDPGTSPAIRADGYYLDAAYFLPYQNRRDKLQLAAGYQKLDANTSLTDQYDMTTFTLGLNYHLVPKYQNIVKACYLWVDEKVNPVDNNKLVLQYQLWF